MAGASSDSPWATVRISGCELFPRCVFEEEAAGAGFHRAVDVGVKVEGGQNEYACAAACVDEPVCRFDPVELGHANVHDEYVGVVLAGCGEGLVPVAGFADDGEVVLSVEHHA